MISSIKPNKAIKILIKILKVIVVTAFWVLVWEVASRLVSKDNELMLLILPSPKAVFQKWLSIAFTKPYLTAVGKSLVRILSGFLIGVVAGAVLGVATHLSKVFDLFLSPAVKVVRAVPVIAISILLFLFFKSDTLPVCIVCLMVIPIIWQTVYDGLNEQNKPLSEMAKVYNLSKYKRFLYIKVPSVLPSLVSSCVSAMGLAWKSGIAAEVISLPKKSLGTKLWQSKGSIDFDEVYAVTLTVVILSIVIEFILKKGVAFALKKAGVTK